MSDSMVETRYRAAGYEKTEWTPGQTITTRDPKIARWLWLQGCEITERKFRLYHRRGFQMKAYPDSPPKVHRLCESPVDWPAATEKIYGPNWRSDHRLLHRLSSISRQVFQYRRYGTLPQKDKQGA